MPFDDNPAPGLEARLRREIRGEVMFDTFSRGRYSTDASIYQIQPLGIVVPEGRGDAAAAIAIAREGGVPVLSLAARHSASRPSRARKKTRHAKQRRGDGSRIYPDPTSPLKINHFGSRSSCG